jgi:hypothetical protein
LLPAVIAPTPKSFIFFSSTAAFSLSVLSANAFDAFLASSAFALAAFAFSSDSFFSFSAFAIFSASFFSLATLSASAFSRASFVAFLSSSSAFFFARARASAFALFSASIFAFSYKGFDLSINLTGSVGNEVVNWGRRELENPRGNNNILKSALDYAQLALIDPNGPDDYRNIQIVGGDPYACRMAIAKGTDDSNYRFSDRFVEDAQQDVEAEHQHECEAHIVGQEELVGFLYPLQ